MIRVLCKNQTFMLVALDGSKMFTNPGEVNEIDEKFATDPTFNMAVEAGALEPIKSDRQAQKKADNLKNPKKGDGKEPDDAT